MEYANQWELELSLTGGNELELHHEHELINCACTISNHSYYSCSRPTANVWALTEYIGLPWSRIVMHIALMLTSMNNNLPNTSLYKLSSYESTSESLSLAEADYITRAVADAQLMLDYFSLVIMVLVNAISLVTLAFYRLRRPPPYFDNPKAFLSAQASYNAEAIRIYKQKEQERREAKDKKHANNEEQHKKEEESLPESNKETATIGSSNTSKDKGKVKSKSDSSAAYKDVTKTCVCAHEYLLKNTVMYLLMFILIGLSASLFLIRTSVLSVTCTWPFVVVLFAMWSMNAYLRTELHHIYTRPAANKIANNTNNSEQDEKQNTPKGKAKAVNVRNRKDDKFFVSSYAHVSNLEETNNAYVETSTWCVSSPVSLFELYDIICVSFMLGALLLSLTGSFVSTCVAMIICYTVMKLLTLFVHWQSVNCAKQTQTTKAQWSTKMLCWLLIGLIVLCIMCAVSLTFSNWNVSPLVQDMRFTIKQKIELVIEYVTPHISDLLCVSRYYYRNYSDHVVFVSRMATRFVAAAMFCAVIVLIWLRLIHLNLQPDEVRLSKSNN